MGQGFQTENLLTANVNLPRTKYAQAAQIAGFYRQLLERVERLPGVNAAGAVQYLPLSGIDSSSVFMIEGARELPAGQERRAYNRNASPGYFKAMGIRLIQGRDFSERDVPGAPKVAIVNETMSRRYWPNGDALGQHAAFTFESLRFRRDGPPDVDIKLGLREIVGVVADVKHSRLDAAPAPEMFLPHAQSPSRDMTLVVRTAGEPAGLIRVIQNEVAALDPDQPLSGVATMSQLVAGSMAPSRFQSGLLSVFAASALILAAIGIYGLIAFSVSQRTREIGVRMALGAARRDVLIMVVKQGLILVLIGGGTGLVAALGLARLLRHLLPGVRPTDPVTFIAVSLVLVAVALLAGYIPARRAMKINPMEALRYE